MSDVLTIIGIVISIVGLFVGGKFLMKFIGRDDNSINIGDNNQINNSLNNEKNIFSKNKK